MADMVQVRRPSNAQQYQAPQARLGRSQIAQPMQHKTTFNVGELIPYFVAEVVPGDTYTCRLMAFARIFSPLSAPVMDNIELGIDFFFVPNRILWDNWERFLGASDTAGPQTVEYTVPILLPGLGCAEGDVAQYMGVPIGASTTDTEINALPLRAYYRIYSEWYRDQNLIDVTQQATDDGPDDIGFYPCFKSAKRHDYFTSALPYLQKGDAPALLTGPLQVRTAEDLGNPLSVYSDLYTQQLELDATLTRVATVGTTGSAASALYIDLGDIDFSINALRQAAAIQRLLERDARGGTRHPELIKAHFGVDVPDMRTQRPEYLGGGHGYINISPVANTSATATEEQGNLAGIGTGILNARFAKSFVEHGWIIGMLRARGEISYQQGLERFWSRSTKYDFLWPEFAQLGEQPIYNREIFLSNSPGVDGAVFGYQERYADYRYRKSLVTGKFASDATGSLDFWHLSEDFATVPSLNQAFIEDATPMARIQAVPNQPDFIIDGRFDLRVARILPVRPVPTLMPARF